jgi:hypothetical protein
MSASYAFESRGGWPHQSQSEVAATASASAIAATRGDVAQASSTPQPAKEFISLAVKQKLGAALRELVPQSAAAVAASYHPPALPLSAPSLQSTEPPVLHAVPVAAAPSADEPLSSANQTSVPAAKTVSAATIATSSLASVQRLRAFERYLTQLVLSSKNAGKLSVAECVWQESQR